MIPKIIHLCWLSGDPYPPEIQKCLDSWKKYLPDYEIWLWDTKRFNINSTLWTKQAFDARKFAFAADYIRLYALYNYGGIYLDSDVLVYKSFAELLSLPYFIGHDQIGGFETAVIGSEKGCQWIKEILGYYDGRPFIKENGDMDIITLPVIFHHILINNGYRFTCLHRIESYKKEDKMIKVFDGDFFNSRDSLEVHKTSKSFCAHNYAGSWQKDNGVGWKNKIKKLFPKNWIKLYFFISHNTWNKNKFKWYTIPFMN